jgi:hypothetical protein
MLTGGGTAGDPRYRARGKLLEASPEDPVFRIISPVRAAVSVLPAGARHWSAVRIVSRPVEAKQRVRGRTCVSRLQGRLLERCAPISIRLIETG